jgi:dTDP-4-dehydrorhamnose 3,5-epimerase
MSNFSTETIFNDAIIIHNKRHLDDRGYYDKFYFEPFFSNLAILKPSEISIIYAKSKSLRGLHLQINNSQAKLIHVLQGSIFDVILDLRKNSKTFGMKYELVLSQNDEKTLFVPEGFAHGFCALSDSIVLYTSSTPYDEKSSTGIIYSDNKLKINWPKFDPQLISKKDLQLDDFETFLKKHGY